MDPKDVNVNIIFYLEIMANLKKVYKDPEFKKRYQVWLKAKKRHIADSDMSNSNTTKL